jgi:hypothetical protein
MLNSFVKSPMPEITPQNSVSSQELRIRRVVLLYLARTMPLPSFQQLEGFSENILLKSALASFWRPYMYPNLQNMPCEAIENNLAFCRIIEVAISSTKTVL